MHTPDNLFSLRSEEPVRYALSGVPT